MKIIFMGSPDFAIPTLKKLNESAHEVVAVYTQPPKPANRGLKLLKSKVHIFAEENGLTVKSPKSLREEENYKKFQSYEADIAVVAAYGLILPKEILEGAKLGCINIHPSLLPKWRGAAPIQRPIMAGDRETGICIMKMDEGLDTGDIISEHRYKIAEKATASDMHNMLAEEGADMLLAALDKIEGDGTILNTKKQSENGVTYAEKIKKEDKEIDFNNNGKDIINQIRGLADYPAAHLKLEGKKYKIFKAEFEETSEFNSYNSGYLVSSEFEIKCADGIIKPLIIQKEGKKRMNIEDFLRGNKIEF